MVNARSLIKKEASLLTKIRQAMAPGESSLLVGSIDFAPLLLTLKTRYHYLCDDRLSHPQNIDLCLAQFHELPFEANSMDFVLLPHTLEQTDTPSLVLEEAVSTLAPNGRLVIFGTKDNLSTIQQWLNNQPLILLSVQYFSLPFSGISEPWETYAEKCMPFLCQAYILVAQKIVHSPLILPARFIQTSPAFKLRGEHACSKDIH